MPIPTKNNEETNEQFMDRCMNDATMIAEFEDNDQRLAVCINQLEDFRALKDIETKPTQEMAEEAQQGLDWRKEFGRGGTSVGVSRARDISNRVDLSIETIKRMNSYFARHEVDKEAEGFRVGEKGYPSAGRIAWALWGGDPGQAWTQRKMQEIKKEEKKDIMENEQRKKVGSMISDGIELPLFDTIEEAEKMAEELGGTGHHIHTMDGEEFYMPFNSHDEIMEVMGNNDEMEENEHIEGHDEEEKEPKEGYYRNISNAEQRLLNSNIELRQAGESATIVGYAAVFNSRSENLGGFYEYIDRKAFDKVMENEPDTRFLINHEGMPLGRTTAGTLRLSVDDTGLRYEVDLPNTQTANELREALKRGDVNQSSFAFSVDTDKWSEENGTMRRDILSIHRLLDVSAVTFPAYPNASVGLRSMNAWIENQQKVKAEKEEYKREENDLHYRSIRELKIKLLKSEK